MDVDPKDIQSMTLRTEPIQRLLVEVEDASQLAAEARDREGVKNPELRRALKTVESFLRRTRRLCYGGMAINAHLPEKDKFYHWDRELPDYDFFSPSAEQDANDLAELLTREGFRNVSIREGMHEGTQKVYVDFNSVADCTQMPQWIYTILHSRAIKENGIYFVDAEYLRMAMYLELSRPRGEVERWYKVYKRLLALNLAYPPDLKECAKIRQTDVHTIPKDIHADLVEYILLNDRIFLGQELERVYRIPTQQKSAFLVRGSNTVLFFSPDPRFDMEHIKELIHKRRKHNGLRIVRWDAEGDIFPELYAIVMGSTIVCIAVQEGYCQSYNTLPMARKFGKRLLRIASLDTAIYMFYLLSYVKGLKGVVNYTTSCFAKRLVDISLQTRDRGAPGKYPMFAIPCEGYQPTRASLIRAKVERMRTKKRGSRSHRHTTKKKH